MGELRVCYMKGRSNYLCRKKLYDLTGPAAAERAGGDQPLPHHQRLGEDHRDRRPRGAGRLAREQPSVAEARRAHRPLHRRATASSSTRCFITEMRRRAAESDIIIVNHHLFCADLAIKAGADRAPDAGVLPDAGVVVFDEAHELEDVATNYFGVTVSNLRVEELLRDVEHTLRRVDVPITDSCRLAVMCATARSSSSR